MWVYFRLLEADSSDSTTNWAVSALLFTVIQTINFWWSNFRRWSLNKLQIQGEHKVFPWLQTYITRKLLYVEYKHILFFRNVTHEVFFLQHINTLPHVLLLLHGERLIIISFSPRVPQHVFSYCSKSVCYSCLQICNIWNWCRKHYVLNIPP